MKFTEYVEVNPKTNLKKGEYAPFVEMANVSITYREPEKVEYKKYTSGPKFQNGDSVVARIEPCLQNGKRFFWKSDKIGFGSTEYIVFRAKEGKMDSKYFFYLLKTDYIKKSMVSSMVGATGRQRVNNDIFGQIEIVVPNIDKQKKIGRTLFLYDDLIENNQKQIQLLEEAARRLYKEWFVDLRFPGHENTKIVDGVPEGWSKSMVSEVSAVLRRGISPKYNEKARGIVINQKCIRQTIVSYDEARTQEKKYPAELEMMESDIVICSTGAGTLGRVGQIFEAKGNATLDSHVTLIRANEKIGQQYLFWSLKMQQDYLMSAGKGSTNQLELSRETIGNCKILIPEQKIAEQAEKNFAAIHDKMKECSMQIARLREARDLLLPKLMSGEVEV